MTENILEAESLLEITEAHEAGEIPESQAYYEKYTRAQANGDVAAARYYLGKYQESLEAGEQRDAPEPDGESPRLGSSEEDAEEIARERSSLERKLRDAEGKLHHAEYALSRLLMKNSGATPSMIKNREYQIRVYKNDIQDLQRELSRLE